MSTTSSVVQLTPAVSDSVKTSLGSVAGLGPVETGSGSVSEYVITDSVSCSLFLRFGNGSVVAIACAAAI